jgi:predicted N-acetyltransferase YhbS
MMLATELGDKAAEINGHSLHRHGRACPGHPRLLCREVKVVDARHKAGHDAESLSEPSLTILPETAGDAAAIERLHERTFGPGRYARTAFRIREGRGHVLGLSFTARIGTLLVGSVRLTPICIGDTPALLLGPLTVEPPFRSRGVGSALVGRALKEAKAKGHKLVVLVGDEPIYQKSGFKRIAKGQVKMPGPVDPARLLVAELQAGAFDGVKGVIRPDWERA